MSNNSIINTNPVPAQILKNIQTLLAHLLHIGQSHYSLQETIQFAYGDTRIWNDVIHLILRTAYRSPQDAIHNFKMIRRQTEQLFIKQFNHWFPTLTSIVTQIITREENDLSVPIQDVIRTFIQEQKLNLDTELIRELFPFYQIPNIISTIMDTIDHQFASQGQQISFDTKIEIVKQIIASLNYLFLTIHLTLLLDYRTNMPHETTFNPLISPPWGKRYDGKTRGTNITYTPILREPNQIPYHQRLSEIGQITTTINYDDLIIAIPIGESDSIVPIHTMSRPALIMTYAFLQLQQQQIPQQDRSETEQALNGLLQHQLDMIYNALQTQEQPEHAPVWLFIRQEPGILSITVNQQDINQIRIGPLRFKIPVSFMPKLRETLRQYKLLPFFMTAVPANMPRSTSVRLSKLISLIGRATKTSMDLFGGLLVAFSQNLIRNLFSKTSWQALLTGYLFGWAPYKFAGTLYQYYKRQGRTQRNLDTETLYTLLQLQFNAIRDPATPATTELQYSNPRNTEHLPLVFSTTHEKMKQLYNNLYQYIRTLFEGTIPTDRLDNETHQLTEMFIIRAMLDENVWHEEPNLLHDRIQEKLYSITDPTELYTYLGSTNIDAQRYLSEIVSQTANIPQSALDFIPTPGESHLFKIHNRFYTHLMRLHGYPIREPMSALLLMEHLLMDATIANFLQRSGIGTGIMRPEGMLSTAIIPTLQARGIGLNDDESRVVYRGALQYHLRKLYDAYRHLHHTITNLNILYQELPTGVRTLNTLLTAGLAASYLAGSFNPFTLPLFIISSFFTLSNFLKKIYWLNMIGYELQRDLYTYERALHPAAQISLLSNSDDTNQLIRNFLQSIETMQTINHDISTQGAQSITPDRWLIPETFIYSPGSTRFILQLQPQQARPQHEIVFSEPHSIALIALILRPDMLKSFIRQLEELKNQLPSIQELETYIQHYLANVSLQRSYQIAQIGQRYFLRTQQARNRWIYYELGWYKENIEQLIRHYNEIYEQFEQTFDDDYHQQLLASEFVLRTLIERKRQAYKLPDTEQQPLFMTLVQNDLQEIIDQIFTDLDIPFIADMTEPDDRIRNVLQHLMLYSARVETALNELAFLPLELTDIDIRTMPELEALSRNPEVQETIRDAQELARQYAAQILDPLKTDMLGTFLIHVNFNNRLYETIRDTIAHVALAPNVVMSQLIAVPHIFRSIYRMFKKLGKTRTIEETKWSEQLTAHGASAVLIKQFAITGSMLLLALLAPSLYCRIPAFKEIWDKTNLSKFIEFECRTGRFGAFAIGYDDQKISFRPAYVLDLATRIFYDILMMFRPQQRDPEEQRRLIVDTILFRPMRTFYDWLAIRIPPLESSAVGAAELLISPADIEILERIRENEPILITNDHHIDDFIQMVLNNFMPMGIENARETFARLIGANSRSPLWTWLTRDEAIQLREPAEITEPNRVWGYPLGLPDWNRFVSALPSLAQSFSLRTVRPYNPLNQINIDVPILYELGIRTPKGAIESQALFNNETIGRATNSYSTRTKRNADYNRILNGISPLLYSILELVPYENQQNLREWLETRDFYYSALIGRTEPIHRIGTQFRQRFLDQPAREIRVGMMLYEFAQMHSNGTLQPFANFRQFSQQRIKAQPATLNGIIQLGAEYATMFHNEFNLPAKNQYTLANAIRYYHLYAATELYRLLASAINTQMTENLLKQAAYDMKRKDKDPTAVYIGLLSNLRNFVVNYVNGNARTDEERQALYQYLLHKAITGTEYTDSYSPSYSIGYLFGLGLFFAEQQAEITKMDQYAPVQELTRRFTPDQTRPADGTVRPRGSSASR